MTNKICINIWDDYPDDGLVTVDQQVTFAYIEGGTLTEEEQRAVLIELNKAVERVKPTGSAVVPFVYYHKYPWGARWHLQLKNLPHAEREQIVDMLAHHPFQCNGIKVVVYSES